MYKHLTQPISILLLSIILLSSCTSKKKLIYFQGTLQNSESNKNYTPTLQLDDLLSISIGGLDQDAIKPFNLPIAQANNLTGGYTTGSPTPQGFLIDAEGNVELPVIGKIKLAGLTRIQATDLLKQKLTPYLQNPIVQIRIINFKITVLGEVRNPGTFTIPNERVTLPEALGIAGDLNITGVRKNVLVIREVDGKKTETRIDLTSKELFSSPVYYLNQNDVLYVEPNRSRVNSSVINTANAGIAISIASLLTTIIVLLSR